MKTILIILGVLALGFIIVQLYAMSSQQKIETYPYEVVKKYGEIEIRNYEARLFTSVKINSSKYDEASSSGFSVLAGYIFGGNSENEKIAMTSPVSISLEDTMDVMFMVPKEFDKTSLPTPNQSSIKFVEEPAKTMAAVTFGGWASDEKIERYKTELIAELEKQGIKFTNRYYVHGFNAPYEMLNRKNEVLVELETKEP